MDKYSKTESFSATVKNSLEKPLVVKDSLNSRLETGIHALEIAKLKASDFELNNRESQPLNLQTKTFKSEVNNTEFASDGKNIGPFKLNKTSGNTLSAELSNSKSQNPSKDQKSTKDSLIWISLDDKDPVEQSNKKKIIEKRLSDRKNDAIKPAPKKHTKSSSCNRTGNKKRTQPTEMSEIIECENLVESINKMPLPNKYNLNDHAATNSSIIAQTPVQNTAVKAKGMKGEWKNSPIMVDLFTSEESHTSKRPNGVLESGDNPICSISSKSGMPMFRAFQGDDSGKLRHEEPIVIPATGHETNSSLAEMFMSKKANIMNRLNNRDNCKSKNQNEKKPKTKEELFEIRKKMMKRNRSTSPKVTKGQIAGAKPQGKKEAEV